MPLSNQKYIDCVRSEGNKQPQCVLRFEIQSVTIFKVRQLFSPSVSGSLSNLDPLRRNSIWFLKCPYPDRSWYFHWSQVHSYKRMLYVGWYTLHLNGTAPPEIHKHHGLWRNVYIFNQRLTETIRPCGEMLTPCSILIQSAFLLIECLTVFVGRFDIHNKER